MRYRRFSCLAAAALLACLPARAAHAGGLGSLLPMSVPGFGTAPGVSARSRLYRGDLPVPVAPLAAAGLEIFPRLTTAAGLDTAPASGAPATATASLRPEIRLLDQDLGLAGFAAVTLDRYARDPAANANRLTTALGLALPFGPDRLTLGLAHVDAAETALGLAADGGAAPLDVTTDSARAGLRLGLGALDAAGSIAFDGERVSGTAAAATGFRSRQGLRAELRLENAAPAPLRALLMLRAGTVRYPGSVPGGIVADSSSLDALAGIVTDPRAIWRLRVIAGAERTRYGAGGPASGIAAIGDAALEWTPDDLIAVDLDLSRSAGQDAGFGSPGSILTTERLGLAGSYSRSLLLTLDVAARQGRIAGHAAAEIDLAAGARWRLSRALSLRPSFRLAVRHNLPGAASRQLSLTLSLVWTP